ncbi:MAG TPA: hypothetical protein PKH10_02185 [bacterium]|nr:hypothetical protein [bacterium]
MLRHFYRLMVVALGFFLASSCNRGSTDYGVIDTDYTSPDEDVVDEDVAIDDDVANDDDTLVNDE